MKPAPFAYAKARSLDHAIELLGASDDARLLAGGQSLVAMLNMRVATPSAVIDLNGLRELAGIRLDGAVEIGALVRHAEAERSDVIAAHAPLLAKALPHIGHPAIRNRGTIGGSIAFADPAAELPACLLALDGEVEISGPDRARTVAAEAFFKELFATDLGPRDVLTGIRIPRPSPGARFGFAELARRHGDYALVGLAAAARIEDGTATDVRLAFFGVGETPVRARRAEAAFAGEPLEAGLDAAAEALERDLDPPGDLQASAGLKRHLARVLLKRVVAELRETGR